MSERRTGPLTGRDLILLALAFFGIFIYGLISALAGGALTAVAASALMFLLHLALMLRERSRAR